MNTPEPPFPADRAFTYRATFISLGLGLVVALVVGLLLLALRQPLTMDASGGISWSLGACMAPAAGILSIAILAYSVFYLPILLADRQGVRLDPEIWPATGVMVLGVVAVIAFIGAILLGII